jgi:hypothetical protein
MVDAKGVLVRWILVFSSLLAALWLGNRFPCIGFVFGPAIGAGITLTILCAAAVPWTYLQGLLYRGVPLLPVCRNGCCRGEGLAGPGDYTPVWNDDWTVRGFRCRCGITYQKMGRRFVQLSADGSRKPYLIWSRLKGWIPDREDDI